MGRSGEKELSAALLDLSKAFDRVRRGELYKFMEGELGVPKEFVDAIRSLHSNTRMQATWGGKEGEKSKVTLGVFQGSPISPLLFLIAIEEAYRRAKEREEKEGLEGETL